MKYWTSFWVLYLVGVFDGFFFWLLVKLKKIRVRHYERFPRWQKNLIIASNHPSLADPTFLAPLTLEEFLTCPVEYGPWNTPDKANFFDPAWIFWLRVRSLPFVRENSQEGLNNKRFNARSLIQMGKILKRGGRVITFLGGTRDFKSKRQKDVIYSRTKKFFGKPKEEILSVGIKAGSTLVPVWIEGSDRIFPNEKFPLLPLIRFLLTPKDWIEVKIGFPLSLKKLTKEQAVQKYCQAFSQLADELIDE